MGPDFIIIGAMKCGTSTISAYFEAHPDVFMPSNFEPNYFSRDEIYAKGAEWYEAHFAARDGETMAGEGSNNYASGDRFPESATRMAAYNPDMKIVYIVRNPLERIISAWIQSRADSGDNVPPTLDRAVRERPELFVDQSLYSRNLARYEAVFPKEQIFVGFMEDMKTDPDAFFLRLTDFLGVAHAPQLKPGHVNPSAGKVVLSPRYTKLRQLPLMDMLSRLSPRGFKRFVKQTFFSQKLSQHPTFSPDAHREIVSRLQTDATLFLTAHGKPEDFWRYDRT
ncbi:sulfotransferase domain-containing protein [Litoreibacter meonggei]|uniref:Sulfotransferase domain-containing protein n=1 Tax=Litoreibacter meonggei TaxID=1049199 RepID=A0A497VAG2_9RHOB|nr:sulfotransferase domain-containing protein [Litoreibacter meonggei]RLJ36216.1 sulfotransferase domain-containing protein [Litoreibacter meonggei]